MRLPRDLTGAQLVRAQHHITVPLHDPLRIGTLAAMLSDVAQAHGLTRDELQQRILD